MKPLADSIRPEKLKDIIGQEHLIGKDKVLSNLIHNKKLFSMILYGPPGTGKTTIAYALANDMGFDSGFLNAVINSKKDFDEMIYLAKTKENFVLIMDEIHRLNKDKQDLLLPHLENGTIILIGMTTANPYHSINPAIRSRCQLFELKPLSIYDVEKALKKASKNLENIKISGDAIKYIASLASGDLRYAYNLLEVAYYSSSDYNIDIESVKNICDKPNLYIDKNGDGYYDVISALQKSIRGSDVDASLHYLARLIAAEDLDIIFRRLSVIAYEDIGLANPSIGPRLNACIAACERLGLPEARIPLGEIVIEMALSPKSNSAYLAINKAMEDIEQGNGGTLPLHLKNTYSFNPDQQAYKYPHDYPDSWVDQQYLPDNLKNKQYYIPKDSSKIEIGLKERYLQIESWKKTKK
mgnify:CR=1 FL=1